MKAGYKIVLVLLGFGFAVSLWAKPKGMVTGADDKKDTAKKKRETPVYLGQSNLSGGNISRALFDSLIRQGIVAKDSGRTYKIDGFLFTYAELKLYEDEKAKLVWMTDFNAEYCAGDTLTTDVWNAIKERLKVGDTLYFDNISINYGKGAIVTNGKPMRFEITSK